MLPRAVIVSKCRDMSDSSDDDQSVAVNSHEDWPRILEVLWSLWTIVPRRRTEISLHSKFAQAD